MATFAKYQDGLAKLREMAEILINKRLICQDFCDVTLTCEEQKREVHLCGEKVQKGVLTSIYFVMTFCVIYSLIFDYSLLLVSQGLKDQGSVRMQLQSLKHNDET